MAIQVTTKQRVRTFLHTNVYIFNHLYFSCPQDKQKENINDAVNLNSGGGKGVVDEVFSIESDDDDEGEVNGVRKDDDEIEVVAEQTHNHNLTENNASLVTAEKTVRKFCEFCTDIRRLEKCSNCPEFVVKLTDIYDEYGLCVAK